MAQPSYRTILKYYWSQARKHRGYFALVFVGYGLGVIVADIINPLWYREIIDVVSSESGRASAWPRLITLLFYVGATMIVYNILYRIGDLAISRFQSKTMKDLADFSFTKLTNHSYKFFANSFSGSLVTKVKRFIRAFMDMHDNVSFIFWMTTIQILGVMITLVVIAPLLALFFFMWMALYIPLAIYLTRQKIPLDLDESTSDSKVTARLADVITNILNLKIFSSRAKEIDEFAKVTEQERFARQKSWSFGNKIWLIQSILLTILEFAGIGFSLYLWHIGYISAGTVVLVQLYISIMWHNLWNIGKAMGKISKNFADASELVEVFETPIEIKDPEQPEPLKIGGGELKIKAISFRYGKDASRVFKDFSLTIPAGARIGLVGSSGAGKTTITKLLLRFADVQEGAILIDGQDIRNITQDDLRSKISYVPQDPILFHRTLRENIAYGNPHATEEQIMEASRRAHAHEFISKFPKGYETLVGERCIKLSGGERQRVAIARAMLKDAPILILDEATSSLDSVSERYIQEALHELMKNRTTIVIAHRLSTVRNLDRIIVIKHGAIVEEGTHDELMSRIGIYAKFWEHQTSGFIK